MSVTQRLRDSGLFDKDRITVQGSNGTTTFRMLGRDDGATVYVFSGDRDFAIRISALENERFCPNNQSLYEFVRRNGRLIRTGGGAYRLPGQHIGRVIEILRNSLGVRVKEYRVVYNGLGDAAFEKDVNEAASLGFEVVQFGIAVGVVDDLQDVHYAAIMERDIEEPTSIPSA